MSSSDVVNEVVRRLTRRYGAAKKFGAAQVYEFGSQIVCSINYSKQLAGHKFFYAVPQLVLSGEERLPKGRLGTFSLLICGDPQRVLVIPQRIMLEMMSGVPTRRADVFCVGDALILQTTKHPKLDVTEYLNAFPRTDIPGSDVVDDDAVLKSTDRTHVKIQWNLIRLGRAEGCRVWVPVNDRNLAFRRERFARHTVERLPRFGFDEFSRRIVENIDVLWLNENVITKAFEIESTTTIYSGLLRLNDLVLAQPNNRIDLFVAAPRNRRQRVLSQMGRPSFREVLPSCYFTSFEAIEEAAGKLEGWSVDSETRVTGLLRGEKMTLPGQILPPSSGG